MADFCFQCSVLHMMFPPPGDLAGLCEEGKVVEVICECCGPTVVDHRGYCVATTCLCGCLYEHGEALRRAERYVARVSGPLGALWRSWYGFVGTAWEPGTWHFWKRRRHDWRAGTGDGFFDLQEWEEKGPLDRPGEDGPVHSGGTDADEA